MIRSSACQPWRPDLPGSGRRSWWPRASYTTPWDTIELKARFDRIFRRRTGFVMLDRLLARLHANKAELLMALRRPEVPLHTNGSENEGRCQATRRKISAGTRSDDGRDSRDAFLSLLKTCRKLGVSFWDYLGDRFGAAGAPAIPYLPDLVIARGVPPYPPALLPLLLAALMIATAASSSR